MKKPRLVLECAKEHQGDIEKAKEMIRKAKGAGADAVKFQAYDIMDINREHANCRRYCKSWFSLDQLKELKQYADDFKIDFFCSVFSKSMIKPLSEFTNEIKIPSTYFSQEEFVKECISYFDIIHLSTGMHSRAAINEYYRKYWLFTSNLTRERDLLLYHCVSLYPTPFSEARLSRFKHAMVEYDGLSDHSIGTRQIMLAWFLGATVVEKHFSLRSDAPGWCITEEEVKTLIKAMDEVMIGLKDGELTKEEKANYEFYRDEYNSFNRK